MSIEFSECDRCGETICDVDPGAYCRKCKHCICPECQEALEVGSNVGPEECPFCTHETISDRMIIQFCLAKLNITVPDIEKAIRDHDSTPTKGTPQ